LGLRRLSKKIKGLFQKQKVKKSPEFYKLSPKCAIPNLGFLYEKYFGKIRGGLFVEIGAYDGEYASNTSCLADLGWKGFYVEPVPEYFQKCILRHQQNNNTRVENLAIGAYEGVVKINISGLLSTIDVETKKAFENLDWAKNKITQNYAQINQITLDVFLEKHNIPKGFELLVIDVEGYEWEVLRLFDIKRWFPKMVIIELHDQNPDYPHLTQKSNMIVNFFEENNYRVIYKDFSNTVYVHKTISGH